MHEFAQDARERAEYEAWFQAKVLAGMKAIQDGRHLSTAEVAERARLRRERLTAAVAVKHPECDHS